MHQLIPQFETDFPDDLIIVCENYTLTDDWQQDFRHPQAAMNGSPGFVRLGRWLNLQREKGFDKQHYFAISPKDWIEKMFPFRDHNFLHIKQFEVLKKIKIPNQFKDHKYIQWLYMTLNEEMRDANIRQSIGGCGLVHKCGKKNCSDRLGCYLHLTLDDPKFDFGQLEFELICNCGYSLNNPDDKIGLRSSFQGAIAAYLCNSSNSNPTLSENGLNYMKDYLKFYQQ